MVFKLPKLQKLRQVTERGCAVPVFAILAGVSEDEVCRDLPQASLGLVSVLQLEGWLEKKGFKVLRRDGAPTDIVPCAHLVAPSLPRDSTDFHWVYRDAEGDVHDPSPVFAAMPADDPRMKNLSVYNKAELTISVSSLSSAQATGGLEVDSRLQIEITDSDVIAGANPLAAEYVTKHGLEWWPDIIEPTRTNIRQIISRSFEKKTAFSKVIDAICKAGSFSEARAKLIAETEISKAQVGANLEAWKRTGQVSRVRWMAVGRDPCPVCEQNKGVVRIIGQTFPSGVLRPLAHPSCQCILSPVVAASNSRPFHL
ncbi:MAG: hypothetical protein WCA19_22940 [Candidatus Acidiferrales bacterium]